MKHASKSATSSKEAPESKFKCGVCEKTFPTRFGILVHARIHTGKKKHVCPKCSKKFICPETLKAHLHRHTKEKRSHKCSTCGKVYTQSHNLRTHERTHTGERPYGCKKCKKTFKSASNLWTHSQYHSEERKWKCKLCQTGFVRKPDLASHEKTCSKTRKFRCPCGKRCRSKVKLDAHMVAHGNMNCFSVSPLKCHLCGRGFRSVSGKAIHIARVHKKPDPKFLEAHAKKKKQSGGVFPLVSAVPGRAVVPGMTLSRHRHSAASKLPTVSPDKLPASSAPTVSASTDAMVVVDVSLLGLGKSTKSQSASTHLHMNGSHMKCSQLHMSGPQLHISPSGHVMSFTSSPSTSSCTPPIFNSTPTSATPTSCPIPSVPNSVTYITTSMASASKPVSSISSAMPSFAQLVTYANFSSLANSFVPPSPPTGFPCLSFSLPSANMMTVGGQNKSETDSLSRVAVGDGACDVLKSDPASSATMQVGVTQLTQEIKMSGRTPQTLHETLLFPNSSGFGGIH